MNNNVLVLSLGCWDHLGRWWAHAHALEAIQENANRGLPLKIIVRHLPASYPSWPQAGAEGGHWGRACGKSVSQQLPETGMATVTQFHLLWIMFVEDPQVKRCLLRSLEAQFP